LTIISHFPIHQQRAGGHHADAGGADADLPGVAKRRLTGNGGNGEGG